MTDRKYRSATEELALTQENPARVGDLKRCGTCNSSKPSERWCMSLHPMCSDRCTLCDNDAFHDTPAGVQPRSGGINA